MMPVTMRKLELIILNRDIEGVLAALGESGVFQMVPNGGDSEPVLSTRAGTAATPETRSTLHPGLGIEDGLSRGEAADDGTDYLAVLERAGAILGYDKPIHAARGVRLPAEGDESLVKRIGEKTDSLAASMSGNKTRLAELLAVLEEAKAFSGLKLPFAELDRLSFLSVRIGRVDPGETARLMEEVGDRGFILPLDETGRILAASSRKGRFALDTDLGRAGYIAQEFPEGYAGVPPELPEALGREVDACRLEIKRQEAEKDRLAVELHDSWRLLHSAFTVRSIIRSTKEGLESLDFAYRLCGWVPRDQVRPLVDKIASASGGRVSVRSFSPEELDSVRSGAESVPVLLRHGSFVGSFERLVLSYGSPLYGTIDPTPIVSFFFVLLFSIMFGDVGQGAVIFLTGIFLERTKRAGFAKFRIYSPIFKAVGTGCVIMGLLDGSVFANEHILVPATRHVTSLLTGQAQDRLIHIMPEGGVDKLFAFFGFTICVGLVINSVGLIVNIVNKFRLGKPAEALLGKTGMAGAALFWWAAFFGIRTIAGGDSSWIDIPGFGVPTIALFFSSSLENLFMGRRHEKEGIMGIIVKGLVELIESFSYYISNTMSFLRVGAFALSHAVLSFVVFTMGELLRTRAPAGLFWEILVFVVGNIVIIILEGLIVTIQVVRLQYYEFFSKFFTDTGKEFAPFGFGKTRS